jgi:glucose/arabinose dehydrogenase
MKYVYLSLISLAFIVQGCIAPSAEAQVGLEPAITGLERIVFLTHAYDERLFIVEQKGYIRIFANNALQPEPFLDISTLTKAGGERGLLGLAFHPDYQTNGYFFVNYTDANGDTQIVRYQVSDNPNLANPESAKTILRVDQPYGNHNGGMMAFGLDGYLYIGMGDGGSGGDPQNYAQNLNSLLGKMLRIDVDKGDPYAIPSDNPFVNQNDARPEIWSYGWRNPWRFSFDRETGDLWVGDVGQGSYEEISFQAAGQGGGNYGWRIMEGFHCYKPKNCQQDKLIQPLLEYSHSQGSSVTGGYRYRGAQLEHLQGAYLFGDFASGKIWMATERNSQWEYAELINTNFNISSFGEDASGELYMLDYKGVVYSIRD